jgi:transposase
MNDMLGTPGYWQLHIKAVRGRKNGAPAPRERKRWHAVWLQTRGWSVTRVAQAEERDAHTIGAWVEEFGRQGPADLPFELSGGPPPPSTRRNKRH